MVNPNILRFVCTRCGNCCKDKNTLVNVTYLDILRIIKGLKLNLSESLEIFGFYVFDKPLTSTNLKKMVISPVKTEKGLAFLALMKNSQGACCFYDQKQNGCLIYDLRPMICKSFPFTFNLPDNIKNTCKEDIKISYTEKAKKYCHGIDNDSPQVDDINLKELAQNALKELTDNDLFNRQWNKKVNDNRIFPSAKNFLRIIINMEND